MPTFFSAVFQVETYLQILSRDPLLPFGLCCPNRSDATMVSSEHLTISFWLIILRPIGLCHPILYWLTARCSPICFAYLYTRVAIRTPMSQIVSFDYLSTICSSLRLLCRVSALILNNIVSSQLFSVTRLQCSLYATTRVFARSSLTRAFTLELSSY